jgi:small-conductance mechanosensitive channel
MSPKNATIAALLAAAALAVSACSGSEETASEDAAAPAPAAQAPAPGGQPPAGMPGQGGPSGDMQALMTEYQQIQQRLNSVQQQALADPALQQQYETLQGHIEDEMVSNDPEYDEKRTHLQKLQQDMMAAQQSGDQEAIQSIGQEGNALQAELQQLQTDAVGDEEISAEVADFREAVRAKMAEIDPEVPKLIERADEIAATLQGPAPGTAPAPGGAPTPGG